MTHKNCKWLGKLNATPAPLSDSRLPLPFLERGGHPVALNSPVSQNEARARLCRLGDSTKEEEGEGN